VKVDELMEHLYKGSESVKYVALYQVVTTTQSLLKTTQRVRVRIRRDFLDGRSYAIAELFDGKRWNGVAFLPPTAMAVLGMRPGTSGDIPLVMFNNPEGGREFFEADAAKLLEQVGMIMGDDR
jgi:hypothetical protein